MSSITLSKRNRKITNSKESLEKLTETCWEVIAPFWPLKNLIAVNPLQGFENLAIEDALVQGRAYFQQALLPEPMEAVNLETIKWLQAYLDEGQATIQMPERKSGLYSAWKTLALYDTRLHQKDPKKMDWLNTLPSNPKQAIAH